MLTLILLFTLNLFAQETPLPSLINNDLTKFTEQDLSLYSIRYGFGQYPVKFMDSRASSGTVDFDWLFWLIEWNEKRILIDTGFSDQTYIERFGLTRHRDPVLLLEYLGVTPEQITDVIITHSHFDHIGNAHRFPNANIWIQEQEFASFSKSNRFKDHASWYDNAKETNRLHLINGDKEIFAGVHVIQTGGHTAGHQVVVINHTQTHVFVGDECYTDKLCQQKVPLPNSAVYSKSNNRAFLESLGLMYEQNVQVHLLHDFKQAP